MDNNDEILLNAARAAAAKLPVLEAERQRLSNEIQKVANKIAQYQAIIAGADLGNKSASILVPQKKSKGSCMADIEAILADKLMSATEIQKAIGAQIGTEYGFSTVHSNLQRGEKLGRFKTEYGRWSKA